MAQKNLLGKFFLRFKKNISYPQSLYDLYLIWSSRLFDKNWYLVHNPDVAQSGINPALHYLLFGGFEGRDPGPNFQSKLYLDTYVDVKKIGINPLVHYLKNGQKEGRMEDVQGHDLSLIRSSDLFDEAWYLEKNPDIAQAGVDPALHYLIYGGFEGRGPGPNFYSDWYLEANEDVKKAGVNPLIHYLKYGWKEGRGVMPFKLSQNV